MSENNGNKENENELLEWIKSIGIAIVIAFFIKTFLFDTTYVKGISMYPTLEEKDRLFANKISLYIGEPKKGDIILIDAPDAKRKKYVKRLIGTEGDLIEITDGLVYVNGEKLDEPYIEDGIYTYVYNEDSWTVPDGEIFVLGDNRHEGASKDSRWFGTVSEDSVRGIAVFRFFPFSNGKFGKIK